MSSTGILVTALLVWILGPWAMRLRRIMWHHGSDEEHFADEAAGYSIDQDLSLVVYHYFRRYSGWEPFRPSSMDDLRRIYGIDADDLEACLGELLHTLGLEMPHSGELLEWNDAIVTVKDVLRFCQWVRLAHAK